MSLAGLFQAIMEHSLLTTIMIVDILLIGAIVVYIVSKLYEKKRPDQSLILFLKKSLAKKKLSKSESIEGLYGFVIDTYRHKGIRDSNGFRVRQKILDSLGDEKHEKEKEVVKMIFENYECKIYGGGLQNEEKVVNYLFNQFSSL